jgi:hypothetical protein
MRTEAEIRTRINRLEKEKRVYEKNEMGTMVNAWEAGIEALKWVLKEKGG